MLYGIGDKRLHIPSLVWYTDLAAWRWTEREDHVCSWVSLFGHLCQIWFYKCYPAPKCLLGQSFYADLPYEATWTLSSVEMIVCLHRHQARWEWVMDHVGWTMEDWRALLVTEVHMYYRICITRNIQTSEPRCGDGRKVVSTQLTLLNMIVMVGALHEKTLPGYYQK